jgi:hypothetical protein
MKYFWEYESTATLSNNKLKLIDKVTPSVCRQINNEPKVSEM